MEELDDLKDEIYTLKFGECAESDFQCYTRVPGGWIYQCINPETENWGTGVFIPWNNEFQ